jgi:hypothetical protein
MKLITLAVFAKPDVASLVVALAKRKPTHYCGFPMKG